MSGPVGGVQPADVDWEELLADRAPPWVAAALRDLLSPLPTLKAVLIHGSLGRGEFSVLEVPGGASGAVREPADGGEVGERDGGEAVRERGGGEAVRKPPGGGAVTERGGGEAVRKPPGGGAVTERGGVDLALSDVELVLVPRDAGDAAQIHRRMTEGRDRLRRDYGAFGPFFSVDYSVCTERRLRTLPRWFLTFEKRHGSLCVGDEAVLNAIRRVDADNIDLRESNETVVWRLLHLLHHAPADPGLGDGLSPTARRVWAYVCHRDVLDFTTWICPHLGIMEAGFARRVAVLRDHARWPDVAAAFGEDLEPLLDRALAAKRDPASVDPPEPDAFHRRAARLLQDALEAVLDPGHPGAHLLYAGRGRPRRPFLGPSSPRRLASLVRRWRDRGPQGPPAAMADVGRALAVDHEELGAGSLQGNELRRRVEERYRSMRGFLADVDGRLAAYDRLQQWWWGLHA